MVASGDLAALLAGVGAVVSLVAAVAFGVVGDFVSGYLMAMAFAAFDGIVVGRKQRSAAQQWMLLFAVVASVIFILIGK